MAERGAAEITDPEVRALAAIAAVVWTEYVVTGAVDPWDASPFGWIAKTSSPRRRGKIGEQLVAGWCAAKGLDVTGSPDSDADRVIRGIRCEIKFSTLWEKGGYTFQQIRDQRYAHLVLLGVSPFDAHCWVVPKPVAWANAPAQHGGAQGKDTKWIRFHPEAPPSWLVPFGGSLAQGFKVLRSIRISK